MSLVAVAVTLGSPNTVGEVPITTSNLAADIAQAVTDLATLSGNISTGSTAVTACSNDMATLTTDLNTAESDANTAATAVSAAQSQGSTAQTAMNLMATDSTNSFGLVQLLNNQSYTASTGQLSGVPGSSVTLTTTQQVGLISLFNSMGAAVVSLIGDLSTAVTDANTSAGAVSSAVSQGSTLASAISTAVTDMAAISTTTVGTDLTNAQGIISGANVLVQTDSTVATDVALLNGALVSALTFVRDEGILPT